MSPIHSLFIVLIVCSAALVCAAPRHSPIDRVLQPASRSDRIALGATQAISSAQQPSTTVLTFAGACSTPCTGCTTEKAGQLIIKKPQDDHVTTFRS